MRIHSTKIKRAEETAQCIGDGLASPSIDITFSDKIEDMMILDHENSTKYLHENLKQSRDEAEASIKFTNDWCAGLTPTASVIRENLLDSLRIILKPVLRRWSLEDWAYMSPPMSG
jgi:hypothetical protein